MKFSVLLPTRNRLEYLRFAVTSVLKQDYSNWEIIISDNFSHEDIKSYVDSLNDSRIKYFRTSSFISVTDNWNNALEKSSGDYFIMLGDDDCLLKNYFNFCHTHLQEHGFPDLIYNSAVQFTYPNVNPSIPHGQVDRHAYATFLVGAQSPFIVDKDEARKLAQSALNFNVTVNFNAQHCLISRSLMNQMKKFGPFYQSPYPDYYSTVALLLSSQRILAVPTPLVVIGVSPKSFGCYYINDAEKQGNAFLNNIPDMQHYNDIKKHILSGTIMNTSWLLAMETIKLNYKEEIVLEVNYTKYRMLQVLHSLKKFACFEQTKMSDLLKLAKDLFWWERIAYLIPFFISIIIRYQPKKSLSKRCATRMAYRFSHPRLGPSKNIAGEYNNILDVFDTPLDKLQ